MMQQQKRFVLLLAIGLITLLAMGTILAKDNKGGEGGNGNGDQTVVPSQGGNNGNGNGGGNGHGNGGNQGNGGNGGQGQPPAQSTPAPDSSDGLLGCQKNSPSRLDCSSLEVSGVCEGDIAVFTIRNTGEAGNGDMRAPTQYRLVVDGVVVESGSIQLLGGATGQITYSGGGTVTLEADQQIGHPGNSHPRVTLDCGAPSTTATPEPTITATVEFTATIAAPILSAEVFCQEDGSILFVVSNSGGNMLDAAAYSVTDPNGTQVDSGTIQLFTGEQFPLQYWGYTSLTLTIGDLIVVASPECVMPTPAPTEEVTPTAEPTEEITPTVTVPDLSGTAYCMADGSILFVIYNNGGDMLDSSYYTVTDGNGALVADGYIQLFTGEEYTLSYSGYDSLTFTMGDLVVTNSDCSAVTPEPTQEVTPPYETPVLTGSVYCEADGSIIFIISNSGADMLEAAYYNVVDSNGALVADGWLQLFTGESTMLQYWGYTQLTFVMGDLYLSQFTECITPTPVPTEEVTPTPEPTQEFTPTPEPTQEFTPTPEPTQEFTPTPEPTQEVTPTVAPTLTATPGGVLGCQKNNPTRPDCSSLQVTGTCMGGVAVFTIRNTGERGNGDMLYATEYRILVDGVVVESGTVQLIGKASMQISYSGAGKITLEADQQTGHPGKSQPQASVSC
jgi:hypothetical protein